MTDKIQEELENMKFCIFCKASPELCTCNNPEPYKFVVWFKPLSEMHLATKQAMMQVVDSHLKIASENYFNADSCDEASPKLVSYWEGKRNGLIELKQKLGELK